MKLKQLKLKKIRDYKEENYVELGNLTSLE